MKFVYMVHIGRRCVLTYNKRRAVKCAKENRASVRRLSYSYFRDCGYRMDYPTFYVLSDKIA